MRKLTLCTVLLTGALALGGCDSNTPTEPAADAALGPLAPDAVPTQASSTQVGWANNFKWQLSLTPPGSASEEEVTATIYFIAPVDLEDENPTHPGVGEHNHVVPLSGAQGGSFTGVANEAGVVPGPNAVPGVNVLMRPVSVPIGVLPHLYAADVDGDGCIEPLTSAGRIEAAVAQGLAGLYPIPVPPFHFAIRPITQRGEGVLEAPECALSA
jgi:hypothetical protein